MAKKSKPKKSVRRPPSKPRPAPLPGMEDHAIAPLEALARQYADIRDSRADLAKQESTLKRDAVRLMHKYGKTSYCHDGITITLIAGDEDVRVKVKKTADDDGAALEFTAERRDAVAAD